MTINVLQHVPFEGPALIARWAYHRGHRVEIVRLWAGDSLPEAESTQFLVIMGGPMSVWEHDAYPWLPAEEGFVKRALAAGVPTLGVCLGAQMIAAALGARVYPGLQKEIGFFPVELEHTGLSRLVRSPAYSGTRELVPFHWHGDTFDLPHGATRVAHSPVTPNQGFVMELDGGSLAVGLQFHLEATEESVRRLVANCSDEIGAGTYQMDRRKAMRTAVGGVHEWAGLSRALLYCILERLEGAAKARLQR